MNARRITLFSAIFALYLLCVSCSPNQIAGGTDTETGGTRVTGCIKKSDDTPASNTVVALIPFNYDPTADVPRPFSSTDTTDSLGSFAIAAPDTGWYNIEAVGILDGERLIRFNVKAIRDSTIVLAIDTLRKPGAIKVSIPEGSDLTEGSMYVPGTSIAVWFSGALDTVSFDSVPVGTIPVLYYAQRNGAGRKAIRHDISVRPDETTLIRNPQWSYCRQVFLNTSASGAAISGDVYGFPVLIRLNSGNFHFTQARNDGGDLMFTGRGNSSLPFEIEHWDATIGRAEIWVKIDTVFGNNDRQFITMYWGAPTMDSTGLPQGSATSLSNGAAVFDTADGFQGVWHLGDAAQDSTRDVTANHYHGVSPDSGRPLVAEGVIGNCRVFDGAKDFITMPNTASSKLSFPQEGNYSLCAWVSLDTFDNAPHCIVAKGYEQYFLRSTYFPSNSPSWEFVEFNESANWQSSRSPATSRQWILLAGVRQGSSQFLYCNGILVDSTTDSWPQGLSRNTSNDLSIGGFLKEVTVPANDGYCFFKGSIDEVRILNSAKRADWVRLCYMNQRPDDRLVVFR